MTTIFISRCTQTLPSHTVFALVEYCFIICDNDDNTLLLSFIQSQESKLRPQGKESNSYSCCCYWILGMYFRPIYHRNVKDEFHSCKRIVKRRPQNVSFRRINCTIFRLGKRRRGRQKWHWNKSSKEIWGLIIFLKLWFLTVPNDMVVWSIYITHLT